jgi:cell division protein DivIC
MIKSLPRKMLVVYDKIPSGIKNRYSLLFGVFFIYMLFFDKNDFITQIRLYRTELYLEGEKKNYEKKIEEARVMRKKLESDKEKYAREKYFVHKPGEDVFVIVRN